MLCETLVFFDVHSHYSCSRWPCVSGGIHLACQAPYSRLSVTVSTDTRSRRDIPSWLFFLWGVSRPACCLGTGWCLLLLEICTGSGLAAALLAAGKAGRDRASASAATAIWMMPHPAAAGSVPGWPGGLRRGGQLQLSCSGHLYGPGTPGRPCRRLPLLRQRGMSAAVADGNSSLLASNRTAAGTGTSLCTSSILVRGLFS